MANKLAYYSCKKCFIKETLACFLLNLQELSKKLEIFLQFFGIFIHSVCVSLTVSNLTQQLFDKTSANSQLFTAVTKPNQTHKLLIAVNKRFIIKGF
jgi:hypothetical protein